MKYNDSDRKRSQDLFNKLFKDLNILTPSFGLFTSVYVQEMIKFIERIVENGYGYLLNSSAYFDALKFYEEHPCGKSKYHQMEMDDISRNVITINEKEKEGLRASSNANEEKKNTISFYGEKLKVMNLFGKLNGFMVDQHPKFIVVQ